MMPEMHVELNTRVESPSVSLSHSLSLTHIHTQTCTDFNTLCQVLRRHILNSNAWREETDGGTDKQMDGWIE